MHQTPAPHLTPGEYLNTTFLLHTRACYTGDPTDWAAFENVRDLSPSAQVRLPGYAELVQQIVSLTLRVPVSPRI